jgi:hypothetical protein
MLIISAKSGQLGNRLFLFSHFIVFAIENNYQVFNPAFEEYGEYFISTVKDFLCRYPPSKFLISGNQWLRQKYYQFNTNLADSGIFNTISIQRNKPFNWSTSDIKQKLKPHSLNFFKGWLFRDGWFIEEIPKLRQHGDEIRHYFRPLPKYQQNVDSLISKLRTQADILIGVHIRQGDYQTHQNGRYFYTIEQYIQVMKNVQELFGNQKIKFLICSNQQQNQDYLQNFSYSCGNNQIIEDMYSLAECDYIIGPPSSYSMWASFYGQKPLYMIRDVNKKLSIENFVHFYQWQGTFYYNEDWSKSYWEWTN